MHYGIDSNTSVFPTGATSKDFYIGRIGKCLTRDTLYFNTTGANLATDRYAYWFMYGPKSDSNYSSSYTTTKAKAWGQSQAAAAYAAWQYYYSSLNLTSKTIFADIEWDTEGQFGWLASSDNSNHYALNYAVFQGFVDYIATYHTSGFASGVYCSKGPWQGIMGTSHSPDYADAFWAAGNYTSSFDIPPSSMSNAPTINGATPTIWQYYGGTKDACVKT